MMTFKHFSWILVVSLLSGCGAGRDIPPVLLLPRSVNVAPEPVTTSALGEIKVTLRKSEDVEQFITPSNYRIALKEVMKRSNLFGDDTNDAINIDAEVFKATYPAGGMEMTSTLGVHYKLTKSNGRILLDSPVEFQGKATFENEWLGASRAVLAYQQGLQGHMNLLLQKVRSALQKE